MGGVLIIVAECISCVWFGIDVEGEAGYRGTAFSIWYGRNSKEKPDGFQASKSDVNNALGIIIILRFLAE